MEAVLRGISCMGLGVANRRDGNRRLAETRNPSRNLSHAGAKYSHCSWEFRLPTTWLEQFHHRIECCCWRKNQDQKYRNRIARGGSKWFFSPEWLCLLRSEESIKELYFAASAEKFPENSWRPSPLSKGRKCFFLFGKRAARISIQ